MGGGGDGALRPGPDLRLILPKTSRRAPQTSPTEAWSLSAWRIGGSRLSLPAAAVLSSSRRLVVSSVVAVRLEGLQPLELLALGLGVDAQDLLDLGGVLDVAG